jgi:hypothetical protein
MARAKREARLKAKTLPVTRREEAIRKAALVEGAVAGQISAGVRPSIEKAAQIAEVSTKKAREIAPDDFVQSALVKAGITDDKLFSLGAQALEAESTKLITDSDGNIVEAIKLPDWQNRHRFWRDLLMVKGHLGSEREMPATGGLMIIVPDQARVVAGHPPACSCQECAAAWNERTKEFQQRAMRSMAIDAQIAQSPKDLSQDKSDEVDELEDGSAER